jgi:hypothetical protein
MERARLRSLTQQLVHLSAAQLKRLPRPRGGFALFTEPLLAVLADFEGEVVVPDVDVAMVREELREYLALDAVVRDAKLKYEMARGTQLLHGSNVWQAMLLIYQHALAAARTNPLVQAAIAPFAAFMKKHAHKTAPKTAPVGA